MMDHYRVKISEVSAWSSEIDDWINVPVTEFLKDYRNEQFIVYEVDYKELTMDINND